MYSAILKKISTEFQKNDQIESIVFAGSSATNNFNEESDLDIYIYVTQDIPVSNRKKIAELYSDKIELNNQFWETGDEWIEKKSQKVIDIMYRNPQWIQDEIHKLLKKHQASVGYSTCLWFNILNSQTLFDRNGWFKSFQEECFLPYPVELKQAIIKKNHPILRNNISSYSGQIIKAIKRKDRVSANHRSAALMASYFDILFALNHIPHPGEKRLIQLSFKYCKKLPPEMEIDINNFLTYTNILDLEFTLISTNKLIDKLDDLLKSENLI